MTRSIRIATVLAAVLGCALSATALSQDAPVRRIADVPCVAGVPTACVTIATAPGDIAGLWQQAQGAFGYIRYNADGTFWLSRTVEDSAAPGEGHPRGTVSFEGDVMTIELAMHPLPECVTARYTIGVLRFGDEPVALVYMPVVDECVARRQDLGVPLVYVSE